MHRQIDIQARQKWNANQNRRGRDKIPRHKPQLFLLYIFTLFNNGSF